MLPNYIHEIQKFLVEKGLPDSFNSVIILGSGLGNFTEKISSSIQIPYAEIPHFPIPTVQGHSGKLIAGQVANKTVLAFSGRFHHYEGHDLSTTVLPVHLAKAFNAKKLIVSNAAGAINTSFSIGDLMVIDDVFRLFQKLATSTDDTLFKYTAGRLSNRVREIASSIGLTLQRGTYLYVKGPNYETPAEIRAYRKLGADVVGMSTAPELIEASRLHLPAAAVSLITNMASGVVKGKLSHDEVKEAAEKRKDDFARLVTELVRVL
jgi:purine-nucleoside phosphorylase